MQQSIKHRFKRNAFAVAVLVAAAVAAAGCGAFGTGALDKAAAVNKDSQGVALDGYDAVAYFTENAPRPGRPEFTADHDGAQYRFASAENRDAFAKDPAKYAPQYGGYCAWAVSRGYTADVDPQTGRVVNGKLYLNYNPDVAQKWGENVPQHIAEGDENWVKLAGQAKEARKDKK